MSGALALKPPRSVTTGSIPVVGTVVDQACQAIDNFPAVRLAKENKMPITDDLLGDILKAVGVGTILWKLLDQNGGSTYDGRITVLRGWVVEYFARSSS